MKGHSYVVMAACLIYISGALFCYFYEKRRRPEGHLESHKKQQKIFQWYIALTLVVSFLTYFWGYSNPNAAFWDENYHIASAEKYIQGVFFQEPHPPLGKMLIAGGEVLLAQNRNIDKGEFLKVDHIKKFPEGYSFIGVRFTNTLAATLSAVFLFFIFVQVVPSPHFAFLLNSFFLFDNALIVHNRSAMLEGFQILFGLLALWYFIKIYASKQPIKIKHYFILALFVGLGLSVKLSSAIFLLLFVFLGYKDFGRDFIVSIRKKGITKDVGHALSSFNLTWIRNALAKITVSVAGICGIFFCSFYGHFLLGQTVIDGRYYHASDKGKEVLTEGDSSKMSNFYTQLSDYFGFIRQYQKGVPRLDLCKKGENGSHAYGWPFGSKSINYRWDKKGAAVRYIYLQGNPVIWYSALLGVIVAVCLVSGKILWGIEKVEIKDTFSLIGVFLALYFAYMIAMLQIERVMYLYHYFIPLIFSFILFALIFSFLFSDSILQNKKLLFLSTLIFALEIIAVYQFFSPLTYHEPLMYEEFMRRVWSPLWQLTPVF